MMKFLISIFTIVTERTSDRTNLCRKFILHMYVTHDMMHEGLRSTVIKVAISESVRVPCRKQLVDQEYPMLRVPIQSFTKKTNASGRQWLDELDILYHFDPHTSDGGHAESEGGS